MKRLISAFSALLILFLGNSVIFAQASLTPPKQVSSQTLIDEISSLKNLGVNASGMTALNTADDIESLNWTELSLLKRDVALATTFATNIPNPCSEYYSLGSVDTVITPISADLVAGSESGFTVELANANAYSLVGVAVSVKIYSVDVNNGNKILNLVSQGKVLDNLSLSAGETISKNFLYTIPSTVPTGTYEVVTYVSVADTYNLTGLPFTDDIKGGATLVTVEGQRAGEVSFDRGLVFLNNSQYDFTALSPQFTADTPIRIEVPLVNTLTTPLDATVTWKLYNYSAQSEANLIDSSEQTVSIASGDAVPVSFTITDIAHATYVLIGESDYLGAKSIINIRFTRADIEAARVNYAGLIGYPVTENTDITLFACAQSVGSTGEVSGTDIEMTLTDETGKEIYTESFTEAISPTQTLIKSIFKPVKTYQSLTLTTTLSKDGKIISRTEATYSCQVLQGGLCTGEKNSWIGSFFDNLMKPIVALALFAFLIILFFLLRLRHQRERAAAPKMTTPIAFLMAQVLRGLVIFVREGEKQPLRSKCS